MDVTRDDKRWRAGSEARLTEGARIALAGATAVSIAAASVRVARIAHERRISREIEDLLAARSRAPVMTITEADLSGLPDPVQRWLRHSGVVGRRRPATVRLKQEGEFRLGEDRGWMPFEAEQYYTTDPPAFLWAVSMRMLPLVSITGRDRYRDGTGDISMRVLSLIPVADKRGGGLNQGALLRFLNEVMWFPAAALSPYITWEAVDANAASATMSYAGVTASATFMLDRDGRVLDMVAERYNDARDRMETWSTPIHAYGEFDGIRVPVAGEGVWKYDSGNFSYIRLRIMDIDYDVPERY